MSPGMHFDEHVRKIFCENKMDRTGFSFFLIIHFQMDRLEKNSSEHHRSSVTGIKKFATPKKIFFL